MNKEKTSSNKRSQKKRQSLHQKKTAKRITKVKMVPFKPPLEKRLKPEKYFVSEMQKPPKTVQTKSELVKLFLETLTTIRLYHWRTHSYAQHKATDELYNQLEDKVDEFVEIMQGKMMSPNRIEAINDEIKMSTPDEKKDLLDRMLDFNEKMKNLDRLFDAKKDSDLLNLRDEIMGIVNRFIYLYSFDKI